jgi:hypothetical protein
VIEPFETDDPHDRRFALGLGGVLGGVLGRVLSGDR